MIFKGKKTAEESQVLSDNPFLAGRTEAAERYGHLSANAAQWRRISSALLLCCVVCVFLMVWTAKSVTVVPYIVQVDEHGYEVAIGPVEASKVDSRLVISHVARYVTSLQTVFTDPLAQVQFMNFVYSSTPEGSPAALKYREYYEKNNPVEICERETAAVSVNSVIPLSADTWQAEWTLERFSLDGAKLSARNYRGIFSTTVITPSSMREVMTNPLGIFITDFNVSEIL